MINSMLFTHSRSIFSGTLIGAVLTIALAFKVSKETPSCAISLTKMNVFYMGVDNPVTITVRGVPEEQVVIKTQGITIKKNENSHYIVHARSLGEASITVSGGALAPTTFKYRIKQLPDPEPLLGAKHKSKNIGSGEFKAQGGVAAVMMNSDYGCFNCDLVGFTLTYVKKGTDPVTVSNTGARYNPAAQQLINNATGGDAYYFEAIRARCPGDANARELGGLAFKIR
jgi:hypothetical protein